MLETRHCSCAMRLLHSLHGSGKTHGEMKDSVGAVAYKEGARKLLFLCLMLPSWFTNDDAYNLISDHPRSTFFQRLSSADARLSPRRQQKKREWIVFWLLSTSLITIIHSARVLAETGAYDP